MSLLLVAMPFAPSSVLLCRLQGLLARNPTDAVEHTFNWARKAKALGFGWARHVKHGEGHEP